jgi:hypothetical protein
MNLGIAEVKEEMLEGVGIAGRFLISSAGPFALNLGCDSKASLPQHIPHPPTKVVSHIAKNDTSQARFPSPPLIFFFL